jgi:serine/threonine protein kinase
MAQLPPEWTSSFVTRDAAGEHLAELPCIPKSNGDYELLEPLGRGGMGVVFKARHLKLNRIVAIKMVATAIGPSSGDLQRFRGEVEAAARLLHPNIVSIHEVGDWAGHPFYSMDLIEGTTLAHCIRNCPLASKSAARLLLNVAKGIKHAHERGILHRDLKPSNILIDRDNQPRVADFGLAKLLDGDSALTQTGAVLGTPSYMAPEQAAGRKMLGVQTDVYGLGAVLYEMITGRPPFRAETQYDTVLQVLEQTPAPPRLVNPKIDRDLETICLKCLEKDPAHRYASADALVADLSQYLADNAISARSVNIMDRLTRAVGRSAAETEFATWGTLAILLGCIVFVCHSASFFATYFQQPPWVAWSFRTGQFLLIGLALARHRPGRLLPTTSAERQLWTIWLGYFLATAAAGIILMQIDWELVRNGAIYPLSALLAGFAFFVMGSSFWGGCYVIGLVFLVMATLMPFSLTFAPIGFALAWAGALISLGLRLRRFGADLSDPHTTKM